MNSLPKALFDRKPDPDAALAAVALATAHMAAEVYLERHKLSAGREALISCIRSHVRAAMPGALREAKQAFDCGMNQIAERTFSASVSIAGIEAAKEASAA